MKDLLNYIVKNIIPESDFEIEEVDEEGRINLILKVNKDNMGLIIGKGGNTVRSIRNLLKVKATLTNSLFNLQVEEK